MKRVVILGVSGSIGMQTVDVIEQHRDQFTIVAYSVGHNIERLHELLKRWPIKEVAVAKENDAIDLALRYPDVNFYFGNEGLCHLATLAQADIVVNAFMGFQSLRLDRYITPERQGKFKLVIVMLSVAVGFGCSEFFLNFIDSARNLVYLIS